MKQDLRSLIRRSTREASRLARTIGPVSPGKPGGRPCLPPVIKPPTVGDKNRSGWGV